MTDVKTPPSNPNVFPVGAGNGITLRDFFAGCAMMGILSANEDFSHNLPEGMTISQGAARLAYGIADAMLKAREGK